MKKGETRRRRGPLAARLAKGGSPRAARLRLLAQDILASYFKNRSAAAEVTLVNARKMRALNRAFRGLDRATSVLSFATPADFPNPPRTPKLFGEIYLCPSVIRARGESIDYLLIHGLLHLLGFDHNISRAKIRMQRFEQKILAWLKNRS
ncbi:MAG: rRNA maturation RNase YbeY [Candidatus Colwellbacteria bacterium CG_4_9_14_0_2_um_filter_50_12]|uniref:Endoribonuclease YbeY n=1 Tax=Candidatus Colwellbacteria bacterium CG_4_9_14_0_2_um_filter_50_12 TaxID=1974538 RepID=A0A2M8G1C4_9BACT|nr:MAG: rRNA maturation RNase YbeY [Candidatus Colwellbacteria bacterium CG_4_9_14_0_2_um_filter_50_12]